MGDYGVDFAYLINFVSVFVMNEHLCGPPYPPADFVRDVPLETQDTFERELLMNRTTWEIKFTTCLF